VLSNEHIPTSLNKSNFFTAKTYLNGKKINRSQKMLSNLEKQNIHLCIKFFTRVDTTILNLISI